MRTLYSPSRLLFITICAIFAAEAVVMLLLNVFPEMSLYQKAIFDSLTLTVIMFPALYYLLYRPLVIHIAERERAEHELKMICEDLEARVEERTRKLQDNYTLLEEEIDVRMTAEQSLRESEDQLRELASKIIITQEEEKKAFAVALHDTLGHTLALMNIKLGFIEESACSSLLSGQIKEVRVILEKGIQETRNLTFDISPPVVHELGLLQSFEWLAEKFQKDHGICVTIKSNKRHLSVKQDMLFFLFRATKELIVNITKHAKAKNVGINVNYGNSKLNISVEDDGVGLTPVPDRFDDLSDKGYGLFTIRERLKYFGGQFSIYSLPEKGTKIVLDLPLESIMERDKMT